MTRLQMHRDPQRDFTADYDGISGWHGLVWVAWRSQHPAFTERTP